MTAQPEQERGASSVEYGLLIAGIAAVLVAVIFLLGGSVTGLFDDSCNSIHQEVSSSNC